MAFFVFCPFPWCLPWSVQTEEGTGTWRREDRLDALGGNPLPANDNDDDDFYIMIMSIIMMFLILVVVLHDNNNDDEEYVDPHLYLSIHKPC